MATKKTIELGDEHFITEKVEVHGSEFLLYRTKQRKMYGNLGCGMAQSKPTYVNQQDKKT